MGEFSSNVYRQNFTYSEISAIKEAVEPLLKQEALNRIKQHGNTAPGRPSEESKPNGQTTTDETKNTSTNNTLGKFPEVSQGRALDILAKLVGVSRNTIKKAEEIIQAATQEPEIKDQTKLGRPKKGADSSPFTGSDSAESAESGETRQNVAKFAKTSHDTLNNIISLINDRVLFCSYYFY